MTPNLVITAIITAEPGHAEAVRAALAECTGPSRAEDGCHRYDLHVDVTNDHRFVMLEEWTDEAATVAHGKSDHFRALGRALKGIAKFEVIRLQQIG